MSRKRKIIISISGVATVLIVLAYFWPRSGIADRRASAAAAQAQRMGRFDDPTRELSELAKNSDVPYARILSDFREWAQYPQDSRPLNAGDVDVLHHGKIELPLMPMPLLDNGKPKEPQHSCVLQAESHTAYEDQPHETKLRCQNIQNGKFVLADVRAFKLMRTAGTGIFSVPLPDVIKNENIPVSVSFLFKPRPQDWGDMELTVDFALPQENSSVLHQLKTHFFSSPQAPAKFTGKFRDRIDNGSLVVAAEVVVRLPGSYRIEGSLFSGDGQPIAQARVDARLGGGSQWVDLTFFGKILRDKRSPGPYILSGVRGQQLNLPINPDFLSQPPEQVAQMLAATEQTEPPKRAMVPWLGEFQTDRYTLQQFSDAEFDSDFKRERIAELEKLSAGQ